MSFFFAILTGLGTGSGGLYILYLVLVKNIPQSEAQGLNLLFFSACMLSAAVVNYRCGRIVKKALFPMILIGLFSSVPAGLIAIHLSSKTLSRLFGIFLVIMGAVGFLKKGK